MAERTTGYPEDSVILSTDEAFKIISDHLNLFGRIPNGKYRNAWTINHISGQPSELTELVLVPVADSAERGEG